MAVKKSAKPAVGKKPAPKAGKSQSKSLNNKKSTTVVAGWLQDATLEIPVPPSQDFAPGSREVEISVGMRQQEAGPVVRSELRGRVLVHAQGQVLALAEASYVQVAAPSTEPGNLPQELYGQLRPHLERLLALAGHKPPLPSSLDKIA